MKKLFIFLLVLMVIFGILFLAFGDKLLHKEGPVKGLLSYALMV
jgi:hypothetical protein